MASQPPPVPPAAMPSPPPQPPAPPVKKTSPWVWVAIGCGGVLLLSLLVFLVGGYFVARKVSNFAKEAEKNPALAAAKMVAAVTPDIEVVEADEKRNTITLRNTKTGEVVTLDANDVKEGRITFKTDQGELELRGDRGGGVTVKTDSGTASFGGGEEYPDWLPAYPGATPRGVLSSRTGNESLNSWQFSTDDDLPRVLAFFERELKAKGFTIVSSGSWQAGAEQVGMLSAEKGKLTVMVNVGSKQGSTEVVLTAQQS